MAAQAPDTLVAAMEALPDGDERGFRFIGSDRTECYFPYAALRAEARRRAALLQRSGLEKGDRLALVVPEGHEFVLSFLGAVFAGVVPVPIFPRASFKATDSYTDTLAHIVRASGSRAVLAMERNREIVEPLRDRDTGVEQILTLEALLARDPGTFTPCALTSNDLCFLQFTSGSTSLPKGVMVTHGNLVANARAFLGPDGLKRTPEDVGVSWLPLFHDMGLIGFILGTLICDIPVTILPTETFARGPRIWLETIHKHRGTITYAPNFAYALAVKRLRDRDLESLDLSCLRVAGCGAEPINPHTMREFAARLAPAGFDSRALLPSYGMAEATLAITFHPQGSPLVTDRVSSEAMKKGQATPAEPGEDATELVSCGVPFPDHELCIVDDAGEPLPERRVGEIVTRGPSITPGYWGGHEANATTFRNGWLHTGDLGYVADGNLYICGRIKDLIIIRGANFYPQDIEWAVSEVPGVRRDNVVAFSVMQEGEEALVVVAEGNSTDAAELKEGIAARVAAAVGLQVSEVAIVRVGTLPKTSSGKVQRRKTRQLYLDRSLETH